MPSRSSNQSEKTAADEIHSKQAISLSIHSCRGIAPSTKAAWSALLRNGAVVASPNALAAERHCCERFRQSEKATADEIYSKLAISFG